MNIINIHEGKTQFSKLVTEAESGNTIVIGRNGKPVAMLVPYNEVALPLRKGGQLQGKITISAEFDQPDPEIENLFYESGKLPGGGLPMPLKE